MARDGESQRRCERATASLGAGCATDAEVHTKARIVVNDPSRRNQTFPIRPLSTSAIAPSKLASSLARGA
jgi:hypothetical protein